MFISRSSLLLVSFLTATFIFTGAPAIIAQLPPGRLISNSPRGPGFAQATQGRLSSYHASAHGVEGLLPQLAEAGHLFDRALDLYEQGQGDAAIPLLERFLEIVRKAPGNHDSDVAKALTFLGQIYTDKEDFANAETMLLRAVQIIEKGGGTNHRDYPAALQRLGTLYAEMGALMSAEKAFGRAMERLEKLPGDHHSEQAEALNSLGQVYQWRGEYNRAEQTFNRALTTLEQAGDRDGRLSFAILHNLGTLYMERGEFVRAEQALNRTIKLAEDLRGNEASSLYAASLNAMGLLYEQKHDFVRAEEMFQRALAIQEKLGTAHYRYLIALNNLASLYQHKADYVRAEQVLKTVLALSERNYGARSPMVVATLSSLGVVYRRKGDYVAAQQVYERALEIAEAQGGDQSLLPLLLNNSAALYETKGDYDRAERGYRRALKMFEAQLGPNHPMIAQILSSLANSLEAHNDLTQAVPLLSRAMDIEEYNNKLLTAIGSERQKRLALSRTESFMEAAISQHLTKAPNNPEAVRLALTAILRRKGRALDVMTDQMGALRHRLDPQDRTLLDELSAVRSQLATLALKEGGAGGGPQRQRLASLETAAEQLETQISSRSAEFRTELKPVTLERVQNAIPANAVLVEFIAYHPSDAKSRARGDTRKPERYAAYVLRRTGAPLSVELGEAAPIINAVTRFRAALSSPQSSDVNQSARALDELVMRPIRNLLADVQLLLLSPDGALSVIPFAALMNERGQYLAEVYTINYLTSGRDLLRLEETENKTTAPVVIANPLYDMPAAARQRSPGGQAVETANPAEEKPRATNFAMKDYAPLPGTRDEAAALLNLLPKGTRVLLQEQATEAALKQVARPSVLHIATHGFFVADQSPDASKDTAPGRETVDSVGTATLLAPFDNPLLRSGLVLAGVKQAQSGAGEDGVLTALEMSGLDLWGTKLVVLSACETGLGEVKEDGEGVYGLRRALVLAGSETQVMSLWKVSDAGTRDLMTAYYARLQKGEGRAEALRQVQLMMLRGQLKAGARSVTRGTTDTGEKGSTKDYRHPYYWAAFIQSGDWRNMDTR